MNWPSFKSVIAVIVVAGFMVDAFLILSGRLDLTDPNRAALTGQVIGYVQGAASTVLAYYFGTTKSSEDKNSTIATIADKIPTSPATTSPKEPAS